MTPTQLRTVLHRQITKVESTPGYIPQGRTVAYIAGKIIYSWRVVGDQVPVLRAVAARKQPTTSRTSAPVKRKPKPKP
jgi:hypothetical protein